MPSASHLIQLGAEHALLAVQYSVKISTAILAMQWLRLLAGRRHQIWIEQWNLRLADIPIGLYRQLILNLQTLLIQLLDRLSRWIAMKILRCKLVVPQMMTAFPNQSCRLGRQVFLV